MNAPWIFAACWKIIQPWLDPETAKKIKFVEQEQLTEYINKDQLLETYGGDDPWTYQYP